MPDHEPIGRAAANPIWTTGRPLMLWRRYVEVKGLSAALDKLGAFVQL